MYDVWSHERDCRCTLKLLRDDRLDHRPARRALMREGRLLQRLSHPHIVRLYEIIREPRPALVLETLPGATLEHLVARGRLSVHDLVRLGMHLCSALGHLHAHGYVHRDMKTSNVIANNGLAKVLDLSIACPPGRGHAGVGTRQYLAPEQARGDWLDPRTDVWGLGVVLFEAATGRMPFEFRHDGPRYPQLEARAPSVRAVRRLPSRLGQAIDACLEPRACSRPAIEDLKGIFTSMAYP